MLIINTEGTRRCSLYIIIYYTKLSYLNIFINNLFINYVNDQRGGGKGCIENADIGCSDLLLP